MEWRHCPTPPLAWFELRELVLTLLNTPSILLSLAAGLMFTLAWLLRLPRSLAGLLGLFLPLVLSTIYSPVATAQLSAWLQTQLPESAALGSRPAVVVLVGRGPAVAAATTEAAAARLRQGQAVAAYVSGDQRSTAERLLKLGASPKQVAGDSCARTTWENATLTAIWLRQHHPGAPVLLITDPWQLPRAARAFQHQRLQVIPIAAAPALSSVAQNRLALRETAAALLYRLQGRI